MPDIHTPSWRPFIPPLHTHDDPDVDTDLSDLAYLRRHHAKSLEERRRWTAVSGRAVMKSDSVATAKRSNVKKRRKDKLEAHNPFPNPLQCYSITALALTQLADVHRPRETVRRAAKSLRRYEAVIGRYVRLMRAFSGVSSASEASSNPHLHSDVPPSPAAASRAMVAHVAHVHHYLHSSTTNLRKHLTRLSCDAALIADVGTRVLSFVELQTIVDRLKMTADMPSHFEGVMKGLIDAQKYPLLNAAFRVHSEYGIDGTGKSIAQIAQVRRNDNVPHIPDESVDGSDAEDAEDETRPGHRLDANLHHASAECGGNDDEDAHEATTITPATTVIDVDALDADITAQLQASMPSDVDDVCVTPFARIRKRKRDHSNDSAHTRPSCVDDQNIADIDLDIETADKVLIRGLPDDHAGQLTYIPRRVPESSATVKDYG